MKLTAEAIGFSTDGGATYPYGFTVTGKMVMDIIEANGINADWINTGTINLNLLKLIGTICGIMQGYGATGDGKTTEGIVIYGNGVDRSGDANPPYIIIAPSGIRGQLTRDRAFYMAVDSAFFVSGPGLALGTLNNYTGTLWCGNVVTDNVTMNGTFQPADGKSTMYLDWTAVQGVDGNTYWALCGYDYPH